MPPVPPAPQVIYHPPIFATVIDAVLKSVQIIAIIVGGVAAYFRWFKASPYQSRLECKISGTIEQSGPIIQILALSAIKNLGISRIILDAKGCALRLYEGKLQRSADGHLRVEWVHSDTYSVFESLDWIESSVGIENVMLLPCMFDGQVAFKLELSIMYGNILWKSVTILPYTPSDNNT